MGMVRCILQHAHSTTHKEKTTTRHVHCNNGKMNNGSRTATHRRKNGNFCHSPILTATAASADACNVPRPMNDIGGLPSSAIHPKKRTPPPPGGGGVPAFSPKSGKTQTKTHPPILRPPRPRFMHYLPPTHGGACPTQQGPLKLSTRSTSQLQLPKDCPEPWAQTEGHKIIGHGPMPDATNALQQEGLERCAS